MSAVAGLVELGKDAGGKEPEKALILGEPVEVRDALAKGLKGSVGTSLSDVEACKDLSLILATNVVGSELVPNIETLEAFLGAAVKALKEGGILLFRQNLQDSKLSLGAYTEALDAFRAPGSDASSEVGFRFKSAQHVPSSIREAKNWLDIVWKLEKGTFPSRDSGPVSFRQFLDKHQYQDSGIAAYEWIFGQGFISPGGSEENAKFVARLGLKAGERVLDVGCGIGGNAFHTAAKTGASVVGVDLSSNMLSVALERAQKAGDERVSFLAADALTFPFPAASFDAVYSRDCIIHIPDKEALFRRFAHILKPGGRVVITDYCVGEKEHTPEFKAYLQDRQYGLRPIPHYVAAFKAAGFVDVEGIDLTPRFAEIIEEEMGKAERNKAEFDAKFPGGMYDKLLAGWKNKVGYIASGDHKWALFTATKPTI